MTQVIKEIGLGLSIDNLVHLLYSNGIPGLTTEQDDAPKGSIALDYTNGVLYKKKTTGTGTNKWVEQPDLDVINSLINGHSWREPALVKVDTAFASLAAVQTAANTADTLDGVTIAANDRVMLVNVVGVNKNVFIVSGSTGAWTFTEDTNLATEGDSVYVKSGTHAGATFNYNGTSWLLTGTESATESSFIRSFIGKSGVGSETPGYSSTNTVVNGTSLETAIGAVDSKIGANAVNGTVVLAASPIHTNIQALDTEAGHINTFIGKSSGVNAPDYATNNVVTDGTSLETAIGAVDTKVGANVTNGTVILAANSINANLQALDSALAVSGTQFVSTGVTTITTVSSVLTSATQAIFWKVYAREVGNPNKVVIEQISAIHDRTASADATAGGTKSALINRLRTNGNISGLSFIVDVNGVGASQVIRLRCSSTASVNVKGTYSMIPVDF